MLAHCFLISALLQQCLALSTTAEPRFVAGQRCLVVPASDRQDSTRAPLVVLPGMAQSIDAYAFHAPTLSKTQDLLLYEAIGLGLAEDNGDRLKDVTLPKQAERLVQTIEAIWPDQSKVNLAGFSMGGRIALATMCLYPETINKVHLTGVALEPSDHARIHYCAWKDMLRRSSNLTGFAWSALLATYAPRFLIQQSSKLPVWVDSLCSSHTAAGLLALLEQTHDQPDWSVSAMADRISSNKIQLCVGHLDRMAEPDSVRALARALETSLEPTMVPNCAHAVPMEAPRLWRESVLQFLSTH